MRDEALFALAESYREAMVTFCQRLIQTPSLPGQEGDVAQLVHDEMQKLHYDEVWVDRAGNVIGLMRGEEGGSSLMLNCHMDHVDPGDPGVWPFPPYSGHISDGAVWGRGASDVKGALATQVYAIGALREAGIELPGDVYVTAVVMEEIGGVGTRQIAQDLQADFAILGEATSNQIMRGHRGRVEVAVTVEGRSAHASAPQRAINPHYSLARFLTRLQELPMAQEADFGTSTAAPTLYLTDQISSNVIPGECRLHLDWRNVPGESEDDILAKVRRLLDQSLDNGAKGSVKVPTTEYRTYSGHVHTISASFPAFAVPLDHPLVVQARTALEATLGREVTVSQWQFATDGGYLMAAGIPVIGFAPGEEHLAHTVQDRISIALMTEALAGYIVLARQLTSFQ